MTRAATLAVVASFALVAVLTTAACGGTTSAAQRSVKSADAFVREITVEFSRGQSGRLWDQLLPSDQHLVTRARFVECQANAGWGLKSLKVLDNYDDSVAIGAKTVGSKAVTLRVTSDDGVTTATMHAVPVSGGWRWILQASDRQAYVAGKCPRTG